MAVTDVGAPGPQSVEALELRLKGLQDEAARSRRRTRLLALLAAVLGLLLLLLVVSLHLYNISQYAELKSVSAELATNEPGTALISYAPSTTGKIEFIRTDASQSTTLIDYVVDRDLQAQGGKKLSFGDREPNFELEARFRDGLFLRSMRLYRTPSVP
jgi:hypothetical protein